VTAHSSEKRAAMERPVLRFQDEWISQVMEHRRILLETLIKEFPEVVTTNRSKIDVLRLRITMAGTQRPQQGKK
jgi:hypothetical protein